MLQRHWNTLSQWNLIRWYNMKTFDITREEYIAVLRTEVEVLKRDYYNPSEEGTGHFNTAIGVLEQRIKAIQEVPEVRLP